MDDVRFGYEAEGTQVSQADPCQNDVAQLPTGGFHDWGVPEPWTQETIKCRNTNIEVKTFTHMNAVYTQERKPTLMKTVIKKIIEMCKVDMFVQLIYLPEIKDERFFTW